jgi:DNA-binding CsgD family transcriptional regulator
MVRLEEGEPLTPREREVLLLTMQGLSCRQIGTRLGRSVKTVESHRYHIL